MLKALCRYCGRVLSGKRSVSRRAGPSCAAKNRDVLRATLHHEKLVRLGNRPLFEDRAADTANDSGSYV